MKDYSHYTAFRVDMPEAGVLRITFNRPDSLNTLDRTGHAEITEIWKDAHSDDAVRAILLNAEGRAFSAGGDFSLVEEMTESYAARVRVWHEARDLVHNILDCEKPIVSAINGPAVGAGLVAALLADISIAGKSARIVDGHTRLGVAAGDHAAIVWPLLCSMAKAKYYLMLCEPMLGEEAERIGLVSLAVDDEALQDKALEVAVKLAKGAPTAIRFTKHALNNWMRSAGPAFDASLALELLGFTGPEVKEGLASYREKRPPNFNPET